MEQADSKHEFDARELIQSACSRAATLYGLRAADAEACEIDFDLHMAQPRQSEAWRRASFSQSWLNSCADNYLSNFRRAFNAICAHEFGDAAANAQAAGFTSADADPEHQSQQSEVHHELEAAISALSRPHAAMLRMRYTEQRGYTEIARAFGSTPDAVRMAIKRALAVVKSRLLLAGFDPEEAMGILAAPHPSNLTV